MRTPTALVLQDLSSVGRCALTVILPALSALGVQVIPLPTALLSAHTAFPDPIVTNMTDHARRCADRWNADGTQFDCVSVGYLADPAQADIADSLFTSQTGAFKVLDPVMGDHGTMYRSLSAELPARFRALASKADLITPNLTEVALLTGLEYHDGSISFDILRRYFDALGSLGTKTVLITGVTLNGVPVNAWMGSDGILRTLPYKRTDGSYPGTGDLFTAVVIGALLRGQTMDTAVSLASSFLTDIISATYREGTDPRHGVCLEQSLYLLTDAAKTFR